MEDLTYKLVLFRNGRWKMEDGRLSIRRTAEMKGMVLLVLPLLVGFRSMRFLE